MSNGNEFAALAGKVERIAYMMRKLLANLPFCDPDIKDLEQASAALRLAATQTDAGAVKVKTLRWRSYFASHYQTADSICIRYQITEYEGSTKPFKLEHQPHTTYYDTLDEAKAGAQADYEQRIRSALDLPAKAADGVRELTEFQLTEWVKHLDWDTGLTTNDEVRQLRRLLSEFVLPALSRDDGAAGSIASGYGDYTPVTVRGSTVAPTLVDDPNSASGKRVEYRPSEPSAPSKRDEPVAWAPMRDTPDCGGTYIVGGYIEDGVLPRYFARDFASLRLTDTGPEWRLHGDRNIPMQYWHRVLAHPESAAAHPPAADAEAIKAAWPNDGELLDLLEQSGFDTNEVHPKCYREFGWKTFTEKLKATAIARLMGGAK